MNRIYLILLALVVTLSVIPAAFAQSTCPEAEPNGSIRLRATPSTDAEILGLLGSEDSIFQPSLHPVLGTTTIDGQEWMLLLAAYTFDIDNMIEDLEVGWVRHDTIDWNSANCGVPEFTLGEEAVIFFAYSMERDQNYYIYCDQSLACGMFAAEIYTVPFLFEPSCTIAQEIEVTLNTGNTASVSMVEPPCTELESQPASASDVESFPEVDWGSRFPDWISWAHYDSGVEASEEQQQVGTARAALFEQLETCGIEYNPLSYSSSNGEQGALVIRQAEQLWSVIEFTLHEDGESNDSTCEGEYRLSPYLTDIFGDPWFTGESPSTGVVTMSVGHTQIVFIRHTDDNPTEIQINGVSNLMSWEADSAQLLLPQSMIFALDQLTLSYDIVSVEYEDYGDMQSYFVMITLEEAARGQETLAFNIFGLDVVAVDGDA